MASKIKKIFKPGHSSDKKDMTPEGEEAQFEQLRTKFKNIKKDVNGILDATRRYVKAFGGLIKPLEEISLSVGRFCHGESSLGGSAIAGASAPIKKAIEDYSGEQQKLDSQIEKYLESLQTIQQRINVRDKLLSDYKSTMKTYTSAKKDDPKIQQYGERYNAAKDAYERDSESTTRDLKDFCDRKMLDFEKFFRTFLDSQEVMFQRFLKAFKNSSGAGDMFSLGHTIVGEGSSPRESMSPRPSYSEEMPPPVLRNRAVSSEAPPSIPNRSTPSYESSAPQLPSRAARASVAIPSNDAPPLPLRTVDTSSPSRERSYTVGAVNNYEDSPSPAVPSRANRMTMAPNTVQSESYNNGDISPRGPPQLPSRNSVAPGMVRAMATTQNERGGFKLPGLGADQPPSLPQRASVMMNQNNSDHDAPPPRLPARASVMMNQGSDANTPPPTLPQRASVVIPSNGNAPNLPPRASVNYTQTLPSNNSYNNAAPPQQPSRPMPKVAAAPQVAPSRPAAPVTPTTSTSASGDKSLSSMSGIPAEERTKYSLIFKREDPQNVGLIEGPAAYALFNRSGLPQDDLAQIWELSDQDQDGALDLDEFVLAMFLINGRLKNLYTSIPATLPPQFILKSPNPQYQVYTN